MNKKLGYYICNGQDFASKVRCAEYATRENKPIEWQFNNTEFSAYNFNNEPSTSLDQLYDQRARELRERYDYLILSYSGGADSHNILMSFYRQGLHIDEIITNWVFDAANDNFTILDSSFTNAWNQNAEYELNTREKLDWVVNNMPQTKITVWDCTKNILTYYLKAKDESWVFNAKDTLNPAGHQRYNYFHIKDVRTRVDSKLSVGIISGVDKLPGVIKDGKFYIQFHDKTANNIPINPDFSDYTNTTLELFYWSPEGCAILAKQAHTILKLLNTDKKYRPLWADATGAESWMFRGPREKIMRTLIYTTWDDRWFQVDKPTKDWDSEFDYWFAHNPELSVAKANWNRGLRYLQSTLDDEYLAVHKRGLVSLASPLYYVGDLLD